MFLRLLFVLLVMLNIVAAAWLLLGQPYAHVPPPTDPGVAELHLLSELPAPTAPATTADRVAAPAPVPAKADAP
ncbi:MAG TPA: SPOR domain-containing protein, partial [Rhodanobacter sp.]